MPNRDEFTINVTVEHDYEEVPTNVGHFEYYLSPGQRTAETTANLLRTAALTLAPEGGAARSEVAILNALDTLRASVLHDHGGAPATRGLLLDLLWRVAGDLGVEWYGVRP